MMAFAKNAKVSAKQIEENRQAQAARIPHRMASLQREISEAIKAGEPVDYIVWLQSKVAAYAAA